VRRASPYNTDLENQISSGYQPIEADGIFDGGDVLPGFKLKVADIFSK